ncbi:CPLN1 protein, partial [Rhinopomastus cyanomelas]|nr:CPLN1 protein [Rhinopomastus cyanomelas]
VKVSLSPSENHRKKLGTMPVSQDLHCSAPTNQLDFPSSSCFQEIPKLIPIEKNVNYSNGFPLLKLESGYPFKPTLLLPMEMSSARPPSVPRVAWSSSASLWNHQSSCTPRKSSKSKEYLNRSIYDPEIPRQMDKEEKRWADTVHKGPPTHLNPDQHEGQQNVLPCQPFPAGIPLLRLQLDQVSGCPLVVKQPVTPTLIPVKPATE